MRYIKLTMQYMCKNFPYIFLVTLVPALVLGMLTEPCSMIKFFVDFNPENIHSFGDVFTSVSELDWLSFLIGIVLVPLTIVFISMLCGLESRHMRWGVLSYDNLARRVNNNFLPTCKLTIVLLVTMQIYALITSATTFLWVKVCKTASVALTLTIIINVLLFLVMLCGMVLIILAMPTMSIRGINMRKAIAESISLMKGQYFKMFFAVVVPAIIPYIIMAVLASYGFWWRIFINTILMLFIISYYITLMYVSYCDICDVDREDLKDKYASIMEV